MSKHGVFLGVLLVFCTAQTSAPEPRTAWPFGKKELLKDIPLVWKPTTKLGDIPPINTANLAGKNLQLVPFDDARANKDLIGENREDADEG